MVKVAVKIKLPVKRGNLSQSIYKAIIVRIQDLRYQIQDSEYRLLGLLCILYHGFNVSP